MRVFCIVDRKIPVQPVGGGGGVAYRLMKANDKYQLFEDICFVFCDKLVYENKGIIRDISFKDSLSIPEMIQLFSELDKEFTFSRNDCFIFHDLESFYALKQVISWMRNSLVMYHHQGGIYYEMLAYGGQESEEAKDKAFNLTRFAIEESGCFGFPSRGGFDALLETMPEIGPYLKDRYAGDPTVIYNGCSPVITDTEKSSQEILKMLVTIEGPVFITVAALNEAKGVERLPRFFKEYGLMAEDYMWIIIGDGKKRNELEKNLEGMEGHVLWIKEWLSNQAVLELYRAADYYIMAHRFSIFDFATVEAMHMGCVPVLTDIGGNKEMLQDNNGFLLDDELNAEPFYAWQKENLIYELKRRNRMLAKRLFSEEAMLRGYYDAVRQMDSSICASSIDDPCKTCSS